MDVYIPAIRLFQGLSDCSFPGRVFQKVVIAPQTAVILSDGKISFPAHPQICPHIIGTMVDA